MLLGQGTGIYPPYVFISRNSLRTRPNETNDSSNKLQIAVTLTVLIILQIKKIMNNTKNECNHSKTLNY